MGTADRKLAYSGVVVLAVIALELAWFLLIGPTNYSANQAAGGEAKRLFLGLSAEEWTAAFTGVLTVSTVFLWRETRRLAEDAEAQASDIKEQLAIARDDFTSTHRPWISAQIKVKPPGLVISQTGLAITVIFECLNHGSSPALGASLNAKLDFWHPMRNEVEELRAACDAMHVPMDTLGAWGTAIMPNTPEPLEITYNVPRASLDSWFRRGRPVVIRLAGCIDYEFSFGKPAAHQTGFIYYIGRLAPLGKALQPISAADQIVPPEGLAIRKCIFLGAFFAT